MTRDEIYSRLKSRFLEYQRKIVELDEPGVISGLFYAFAQELSKLYDALEAVIDRAFIDTASGQDLDRIGALLGCERRQGTKATGILRFYRNTPAERDYLIPKGTRARTPLLADREYLSFETTQDAVLSAGQTYVDVPAQSVDIGSKYNVASNRILIIETPILGAQFVTNPDSFTGGTDTESDDEYRARIPLYLEGLKRATRDALRSAALTVPGVVDAVVEDGETPGTVVVTVAGDSVDLSAVESVISEYKGAGIVATVQSANKVTVDVTFDLYVLSGYDSESVKVNAEQSVTDYLNNLGLGEPAQIAEIIVTIMKVEGVDNVKEVTLNGSAEDVTVGAMDKIVAGTVTATVVA